MKHRIKAHAAASTIKLFATVSLNLTMNIRPVVCRFETIVGYRKKGPAVLLPALDDSAI